MNAVTILPGKPGQSLDILPVWAGHPVGFALLSTERHQFAAFYNDRRELVVAGRLLNESGWQFATLPQRVGWDSHNGIVLAHDQEGFLHLSGNMHADPLVYFRSTKPWDVRTLESIGRMTGKQEDLVTYPDFFSGPGGELCFGYRHGSSGRGDQIYNRYDVASRQWQSLSSGSLISGEHVRNAYLDRPRKGPDGRFHVCWVWRDDPDASSNHDLCYARSSDFVHWETSAGKPLEIPITFATGEIVDPVPKGHGMMNGNTRLGFDTQGNPVISYHKLNEAGTTQIFNARHRDGRWEIVQATNWDGNWLPTGWGSIPYLLSIRPVRATADGRLMQRYWNARVGVRQLELDPETLKCIGEIDTQSDALQPWLRPAGDMRVNWVRDKGIIDGQPARFVLRWESLEANRDQARDTLCPPSMLRVIRLPEEDLDRF